MIRTITEKCTDALCHYSIDVDRPAAFHATAYNCLSMGVLLEHSSAKENLMEPIVLALASNERYFNRLVDGYYSAKQAIPALPPRH